MVVRRRYDVCRRSAGVSKLNKQHLDFANKVLGENFFAKKKVAKRKSCCSHNKDNKFHIPRKSDPRDNHEEIADGEYLVPDECCQHTNTRQSRIENVPISEMFPCEAERQPHEVNSLQSLQDSGNWYFNCSQSIEKKIWPDEGVQHRARN